MKELESRWQELGAFIREQRQLGRISLRKLSEMAGISNPYLSQIERGLRKPSAEILQQIAKALRISAETLYVQAGILEAREGDEGVFTAVLGDPHLTEEQKHALLRVYQSFLHENGDRESDLHGNELHENGLDAEPPPVSGTATADGATVESTTTRSEADRPG